MRAGGKRNRQQIGFSWQGDGALRGRKCNFNFIKKKGAGVRGG